MEGDQLPQPGSRRRGAADPAPQRLQDLGPHRPRPRARRGASRQLLAATATTPRFVEGDEPANVHRAFAAALDDCLRRHRAHSARGARHGRRRFGRPRWPAIVLRTPKGWTGPNEVDGVPIEGTFRAHQVPLAEVRTNPAHLAQLERWMKSYRPEELFDEAGRLIARLRALAPEGDRRMGANPHANGGALSRPLETAGLRRLRLAGRAARRPSMHESTRQLGLMAARSLPPQPPRLSTLLSRRDELEPLGRRLRRSRHAAWSSASLPGDDHVSPPGSGDGGAERAQLRGLARGLHPHRPTRPLRHLRGVRADRRVDGDPARQVAGGLLRASLARSRSRR